MYCTNCGKEVPGKAGFCPACGTRIQASPPATRKKFSRWEWALGIFGGLVILGGIGLFILAALIQETDEPKAAAWRAHHRERVGDLESKGFASS